MNNKALKNTRPFIPIMFKLLAIIISIKTPILAKSCTGSLLFWKLQLCLNVGYSSYTLQNRAVLYIKKHNYSSNYILAFEKHPNGTNIASSSVSCCISLPLPTSSRAAITLRCQNLFGLQDRWDFQNEMYLWLFATIYIKCLI